MSDNLTCRGLCHESCGPVPMTLEEIQALRDATGLELPVVAAFADRFLLTDLPHGVCPVLGPDNRCLGYDARPRICRLYGQVRGMTCPHGCRPKRWLTGADAAP